MKLPHCFSLHQDFTTLPLRALISVTGFRVEWPISRDKVKNKIGKKNKNQDGAKITLEKELELGISKNSRDGFQKGRKSIPNRVNIIVWIIYVYCSVIITYFKLLVRIRSILLWTWLWYQKTLSRPASQIRGNGVATRVGDVYTRGNTPRMKVHLEGVNRCKANL